jgi:hypothetical protein
MRSPEAWSARSANCLTFDIPATDAVATPAPGSEPLRLRFFLVAAEGRAAASVLIVSNEVPGEAICVQGGMGRATWHLSVEPVRRGTKLRIATTFAVPRAVEVGTEIAKRREIKAWLEQLSAIADGRAAWPGNGLADKVRQACAAAVPGVPGVPGTAAVEASAGIEVDAPPADVSRAILGPPEFLRAIQTEAVLYCGYVPGTPVGQEGGLRYFVYRASDGSLRGAATLVAASAPNGVTVRRVTPPLAETTYRCEPSGPGTALELTIRCSGKCAGTPDAHRQRHVTELAALASRWKAVMESLPGPDT